MLLYMWLLLTWLNEILEYEVGDMTMSIAMNSAVEKIQALASPTVCVGLLVATVFFWEHFGRLYLFPRPSNGLKWVATTAVDAFTRIGRFLAYLSSFYTYIRLGDMVQTMSDLVIPIVKLVISPFYILYGYGTTLAKYKYPILIVLGSASLIAGSVMGYEYVTGVPWGTVFWYMMTPVFLMPVAAILGGALLLWGFLSIVLTQ
jgi:hypothetical protein